jgi:hypothetical protein
MSEGWNERIISGRINSILLSFHPSLIVERQQVTKWVLDKKRTRRDRAVWTGNVSDIGSKVRKTSYEVSNKMMRQRLPGKVNLE